MSELTYQDFSGYISQRKSNEFSRVYLIHGDEYLYKKALNQLVESIIPESKRGLNYDPLDGTDDNVFVAIERLNTFSLMPGNKIIALLDSRLFYSSVEKDELLDKAKLAMEKDKIKKASQYIVNVLTMEKIQRTDIINPSDDVLMRIGGNFYQEDWFNKVIAYCAQDTKLFTSNTSVLEVLEQTILKGFAKGNHLIITTDLIDRRKRLYKTIEQEGIIVNCAVPKGNLKAERDEQQKLIKQHLKNLLDHHGKTIDSDALAAISDMQDFSLRSFSNSIEKLIDYIGHRKTITRNDVMFVLQRTRQDPIYELTNAYADRDTALALSNLDNLLKNDFFPLQILTSLTNQTRRLLMVKDFINCSPDSKWKPKMSYAAFQNIVLPVLESYDKNLSSTWEQWHSDGTDNEDKKTSKKKKKSPSFDLTIHKGGSAYPTYQLFLKSENFSIPDLIRAFDILLNADIRLKSTGQDNRLILEQAIIRICRKVAL